MSNDFVDNATYTGKAVNAERGSNNGKLEIRMMIQVTEGPLAGRTIQWSANLKTDKGVTYAKRDMKAAGWKGPTTATFTGDVMAAAKEGLVFPFVARRAEFTRPDGAVSSWWTVGSIGGGAAPLTPLSSTDEDRLESYFKAAPDLGGGGSDDHPNAPGNGSVPF